MTIETNKLKNIIEAALFAVGRPMSIEQIMKLFEDEERPSNNVIKDALTQLQQESEGRGVELKLVASGYRYQSKQDYSQWLSRLWEERPAKYSRAALETLALIAYRQPVTRAEIEDVRGVGVSSSIIKTMIEREWIRVVGHRDVPGRPALYATTKQFLDYFNMKSLEELPTLAEIKDLEELYPELDLPNPDVAVEEKQDLANVDSGHSESLQDSDNLTEENAVLAEKEETNQEIDLLDADLSESVTEDELNDVHTESNQESFYAQIEPEQEEGDVSESEASDMLEDEPNH